MSSLALACRLGAGSPITLPRRVRSILNKYGATLLMPGPAVPILGPELVSNGAFDTADGWSAATGWGIAAGALNHTAASTLMPALAVATQAGKTYQCAYSITSQSAAGSGVSLRLGSTNLTIRNAVGTYSETLAQTVDSTIVGFIARGGSGDWLGSIDNLSIREIVGYQNTYASFAAGNYKESTGNTLAGVDQQVGRVLDASKTAGPELTAGNAWSSAAGIAAVGTEIHFSGATGGASLNAGLAVPGSLHEVTYEIYDYVSGGVKPFLGATAAAALGNSNGWRTELVVADDNRIRVFVSSSPATLKVRNISVRELPGTQAAQATSGFQPYLRKVPKTLGPELRAGFSPNVIGVATPAVYDAAAGTATLYRVDVNNQSRLGISGLDMSKKYLVEVTNNGPASISVRTNNGANVKVNALAGERISYVAELETTPDLMIVGGTNGSSASISGISVREVIEWTYAWQFDGVDDRMSFSAVPFGTSDDFVMISGCRPAAALDMTIIGLGNSGQTNPAIVLGTLPSGQPRMWARNDAGTFVQVQGPSSVVGSDVVLTGRKKGSVMELRVNAVAAPTAAWPANSMALNTATLGALTRTTVGGFFSGHMHPQIMINGAPSDAEIGVLERFIAHWQGRSL